MRERAFSVCVYGCMGERVKDRESKERKKEKANSQIIILIWTLHLQVGLWVDDCASDSSFSSHFPCFHFGSFFLLCTKRLTDEK